MPCRRHGRRRSRHRSRHHGNVGQGCCACSVPQMALTDHPRRTGVGQSTNPREMIWLGCQPRKALRRARPWSPVLDDAQPPIALLLVWSLYLQACPSWALKLVFDLPGRCLFAIPTYRIL